MMSEKFPHSPNNFNHASTPSDDFTNPIFDAENSASTAPSTPVEVVESPNIVSSPETLPDHASAKLGNYANALTVDDGFAAGFSRTVAQLSTEITPHNVGEYYTDRRQRNYQYLKQVNPDLARVYRNILTENPFLAPIAMLDGHNLGGGAYFTSFDRTTDNNIIPLVRFEFTHPDAYTAEKLDKSPQSSHANTLRQIALRVGAKPRDVVNNQHLVNTFIFAHEMGHAVDFFQNYLNPEQKQSPSKSTALIKAIAKNREHRRRDLMTQPIPGQITNRKHATRIHYFSKRLEALGLDPSDQDGVRHAQSLAYRKMSSEAFADQFAISYIMKHYDDFFQSPDDPAADPSKVPTHVGEVMDITQNFRELDLSASKYLQFDTVDLSAAHPITKNGKPIFRTSDILDSDGQPRLKSESRRAFLAENIVPGQPIQLLAGDDPYSSTRIPSSPPVERIYVNPYRDAKGNLKNRIFVQMTSAKGHPIMRQIHLLDREPASIPSNPIEMSARLGISAGSKVQLMKRTLSGDSAIDEGQIIGGQLYRPSYWGNGSSSPIVLGHGIHVKAVPKRHAESLNAESDPDYLTGGNTSSVQEIYRQWKTFYVVTSDGSARSLYEVVPYE